jgi:hypothetical protein
MPTDPEPQQPDRDNADRALIRRAATWLRDNPDQAAGIGIANPTDARALAAVLDILAVEVSHLDADLRRQTVQNCRGMLGETLIRPAGAAGPDPTTARM